LIRLIANFEKIGFLIVNPAMIVQGMLELWNAGILGKKWTNSCQIKADCPSFQYSSIPLFRLQLKYIKSTVPVISFNDDMTI
jgi:hypothetical protein